MYITNWKIVYKKIPVVLLCGCNGSPDTEGWICSDFRNCDSDDWKCDICYHYKKCHNGVVQSYSEKNI